MTSVAGPPSTRSFAGMLAAEVVRLDPMPVIESTQAVWLSIILPSIGSLVNNQSFNKGRTIPVALAVFGLI